MKELFEFVEDVSTLGEDFYLDEAPIEEGVYFLKGDLNVKKNQVEAFQNLLYSGVVVDGNVSVDGPICLDDNVVFWANDLTCESLKLNECCCEIENVKAEKYVFLDACASHGYEVDVMNVKTKVLIYDSNALEYGPMPISIDSWEAEHKVDCVDFDMDAPFELEFSQLMPEKFDDLLSTLEANKMSEFAEKYKA